MTTSPNQNPAPEQPDRHRPGRQLAVISRIATREKGFIFARNASDEQEEFFLHVSGVPPTLWPELEPGDAITCHVTETSKGLRGYGVESATDEESQRIAAALEEQRGNR